MQQAHSMNARKCVQAKKSPTPVRHSRMNQARSKKEEKEKRQERQRAWVTEVLFTNFII